MTLPASAPRRLLQALLALWVLLSMGQRPAQAAQPDVYPHVWLNAGFYSRHFERDRNFREDNIGVGAEVAIAANHAVLAGTFINSDRQRSRYATYFWRPLHWEPFGIKVHAGIVAGAFDGYPAARNGGWFLAAMPGLALEGRYIGANFSVVPSLGDRLHGAFVAQLKIRVW
jgi:hypothetical protein